MDGGFDGNDGSEYSGTSFTLCMVFKLVGKGINNNGKTSYV